MLRKLLTVLAILTGLAGVPAPAQARLAAADAAGIERIDDAAQDRAAALVVVVAESSGRASAGRRETAPPKPCPPVTTIVPISSIQFGDRARE